MARIGKVVKTSKFTEYAIVGRPKTKMVVQQSKEAGKSTWQSVWYVFKRTPKLVQTIDYRTKRRDAEDLAKYYIQALKTRKR